MADQNFAMPLALDAQYWDHRYQIESTGWDLRQVSPPLKAYIDQLENKNIRILIPGCGNTHEATYLLDHGFTQITVIDIAPKLIAALQDKFVGNTNIDIIQGDFFSHQGQYDLILEQTFFCAINPSMRQHYVVKMNELLSSGGSVVGVLFDKKFDMEGPPFGGERSEYTTLFSPFFHLDIFETCYNSILPRQGTELFIKLVKK